MLFTDGTDPVLEPVTVQGNDREDESTTLGIGAIVRVRKDCVGMREPGTAHTASQALAFVVIFLLRDINQAGNI